MFVLVRQQDGQYATPPGTEHSYTRNLQHARIFKDSEDAEREACGNERVVSVRSLLLAPSDW